MVLSGPPPHFLVNGFGYTKFSETNTNLTNSNRIYKNSYMFYISKTVKKKRLGCPLQYQRLFNTNFSYFTYISKIRT